MRTYSHYNNYHEQLYVEVPEELNIVFYHLHTIGKKKRKALPVITVALAVHASGDVLGRGITVCSPDDLHCFCKKEGRIRAAARAIRAYRRATTGQKFRHPNATSTLMDVFSTGMYKDFKWNFHNSVALKHEYMPKLTRGEKALLKEKGLG